MLLLLYIAILTTLKRNFKQIYKNNGGNNILIKHITYFENGLWNVLTIKCKDNVYAGKIHLQT